MPRLYFGQAGHLIVADRCRFHLHTHVDRKCISTVGEWYVKPDDEKPEDIGHRRLYETMVFELDDYGNASLENVDFAPYNTRDAANAGHEAMLRKHEADR